MTFEEKMKKLDEIVKKMNTTELPLEELIKNFTEGKDLIQELREEIKKAEEKIEKEIN